MTKVLLSLCLLVPLSVLAQSNLPLSASDVSKNSFGKNTSLQSSVSFSPRISDLLEVVNDELPLGKSSKLVTSLKEDVVAGTRSAKGASLFRNISPAVVLVLTNDSIGTGSLINSSGEILTNWHVVGNNKEVGIIFKPERDTQEVTKSDVRRARVIKVDEIADLALVKVLDVPKNRKPIKLGDSYEINIGADVHAIGHPRGESWTYTKGVISQYRNKYRWSGGDNQKEHLADVIQTQTPINPGNSGGPLLTDNGLLIGVNSFKAGQSEGLNFAVSVDDVRQFLSRNSNRYATKVVASKKPPCEMKEVYKGKTNDGTGEMVTYDSKCSGKVDIEVVAPYDKSQAIFMRMDRNGDSKPDVVILSYKRDLKWDLSLWDENYDGAWDMVGYHPDGEAKPSRFETYKQFQAKASRK